MTHRFAFKVRLLPQSHGGDIKVDASATTYLRGRVLSWYETHVGKGAVKFINGRWYAKSADMDVDPDDDGNYPIMYNRKEYLVQGISFR